ncbi:hypothetical protein [Rhizobium sp.]|uniref:hypothetical protein n=1 Tax=Rhizobium sp. TaxID=391 RepID=UPI0028A98D73
MNGIEGELKRKQREVGEQIERLKAEIARLQSQQAAFDLVLQAYDPNHIPEAGTATGRRVPKNSQAASSGMRGIFKGFDRRGFVLRTLREAGRPITTSDCALAYIREQGLPDDDHRLSQIATRFSQVLDQLSKANRVRKAGKADGLRYLWEIAA